MSNARTVDFFRLPKDTRERFVGCVNGQASPAPLLQVVPSLGSTIFWRVFLCGGVVAGIAWLGYNGFGETDDGWLVQSVWVLALYVGLLFLGALGILGAVRAVVLRRQLPFPPGKYLFPFDLIDAQTRELRILPLASLESTRMVEHENEGTYTHTAFEFHYEGGEHHTFNVSDRMTAAMTASTIDASRAAIRAAIDAQDMQVIAGLDVFIEPRLTDTWEVEPQPGESRGQLPIFLARWRLAALVAGVIVAIPLWHLRNVRSDDLGFRHAVAWANDGGPGFEAYLMRGRRHADKVRRVFLPRAAIRKAQQAGSLRELEALVEKHRGTPLEAEARDAHRQVLSELAARADRARDLRALREFLVAHPGSHLDAHVRGSIARLYDLAKARYRMGASAEPGVLAFMERLFDHLGTTDSPDVLVRFERRAEGLGDASWVREERELVEALNRDFAEHLARDAALFISFRHDGDAPQSTPRPAMNIVYDATRAGRGHKLVFTVTMQLPGDDAAKLSMPYTALPPAGGLAHNAGWAFANLRQKLTRFFFARRDAAADLRAVFGENAPSRSIAAPPQPPAPVRLPTLPRPLWELPAVAVGAAIQDPAGPDPW